MGYVNKDDLEVISDIEQLFKDYKLKNHLSFEQTPKILIPNINVMMGDEKWCFPRGASRILPFYDVFPVAFFYSQGSVDYSYKNYKSQICENFNEKWLADRNIKYLFVPSDMGDRCINRFQNLLQSKKIIFNKNNCYFIEIF